VCALDRARRRDPEPGQLGAVTARIAAEDDRDRRARPADAPYRREVGRGRKDDGRQEAAPREDDRDAVRDPGELGRQARDRGADEDGVAQALAPGSPGELAQAAGVRVDADEEPRRVLASPKPGQSTVPRAQIDRDPAPILRTSGSVIGALEALAADEVHSDSCSRR